MQDKQLATVNGQPLVLPDFGQAISNKFALVGARRFVAAKIGITDKKALEGKTMKDVSDMAQAKGHSEETIKGWRKEYDNLEREFRKFSRVATILFSADPSYRQTWKPSINAKGELIGANTAFRKVKNLEDSAEARRELDKENSKLKERLALLEAKLLPAS